jgi:hypothetical protein
MSTDRVALVTGAARGQGADSASPRATCGSMNSKPESMRWAMGSSTSSSM